MKNKNQLLLITGLSLVLTGCNNETIQTDGFVDTEADAEQTTFVPQTRQQQQAYALGAAVATRLSMGLEHSDSVGIDIELGYVLQGFNDSLEGVLIIAPAASTELLEDLQEAVAHATVKQMTPAG